MEQITMKKCLHQFIKPQRSCIEKVNGEGDCVECEYNPEENKKCRKYTPINITIIDVEEK